MGETRKQIQDRRRNQRAMSDLKTWAAAKSLPRFRVVVPPTGPRFARIDLSALTNQPPRNDPEQGRFDDPWGDAR